jgi:ABC-type phosphate transport system substrate-binding protein
LNVAALRPPGAKAIPLLAALAMGLSAPRPAAAQQAIAVIVHRSNPLNGISAEDLGRIYFGTSTIFPNDERVVLYEQTDLRDPFYHVILHMNGDRVRRHWIGVVFSGQGPPPPRSIAEEGQLRDLVGQEPGAIGFVDARAVNPSVKVLSVGGLRPGDPGYPLRVEPVSHAR